VTFDPYSDRRKPERSDLFRAVMRNRDADHRDGAKTDAKKYKAPRPPRSQERQELQIGFSLGVLGSLAALARSRECQPTNTDGPPVPL
jgi:hypothetical protein